MEKECGMRLKEYKKQIVDLVKEIFPEDEDEQ